MACPFTIEYEGKFYCQWTNNECIQVDYTACVMFRNKFYGVKKRRREWR